MSTFQKIMIIALVAMASFQMVNKANAEKRFSIKPVKVTPEMSKSFLSKNYNKCNGKYYLKYIKCAWVTK